MRAIRNMNWTRFPPAITVCASVEPDLEPPGWMKNSPFFLELGQRRPGHRYGSVAKDSVSQKETVMKDIGAYETTIQRLAFGHSNAAWLPSDRVDHFRVLSPSPESQFHWLRLLDCDCGPFPGRRLRVIGFGFPGCSSVPGFFLRASSFFLRGHQSTGYSGADFVLDYRSRHHSTHHKGARGGCEIGSSAASRGSAVSAGATVTGLGPRQCGTRKIDATVSRSFWSSNGLLVRCGHGRNPFHGRPRQ